MLLVCAHWWRCSYPLEEIVFTDGRARSVPFIGNARFLAAVLGIVALSFVAELIVGLTLGS